MTPGHWVAWNYACTVLGLLAGYGLAVIPDPQETGWTLVKAGGFILCITFGWLMDQCREQLALIGKDQA